MQYMSYIGTWIWINAQLSVTKLCPDESTVVKDNIVYPTADTTENCVVYDRLTACYYVMLTAEQFTDVTLCKAIITEFELKVGSTDFVVDGIHYVI